MIRVTCNGEFMHAYVSVSPEGDFTCIGEGGCGHSTDDFPDELSDMFDDQPHDADGVREEIERSVGVWLDYGNQTPSNLAYT
ncbi:MAG: hypothetical protein O3B64_00150 [bacterium]|nr:hypothetical protein [bacterium]